MVEERYHVTVWNWFYPGFITPLKNMTEEEKFSAHPQYMTYLLTAIGLSPSGSITVHIYTQTIHRTTQITANLEECGPCSIFASFTLTFALQLRKKKVSKVSYVLGVFV